MQFMRKIGLRVYFSQSLRSVREFIRLGYRFRYQFV